MHERVEYAWCWSCGWLRHYQRKNEGKHQQITMATGNKLDDMSKENIKPYCTDNVSHSTRVVNNSSDFASKHLKSRRIDLCGSRPKTAFADKGKASQNTNPSKRTKKLTSRSDNVIDLTIDDKLQGENKRANIKRDTAGWECSGCTLWNEALLSRCNMCRSARPKGCNKGTQDAGSTDGRNRKGKTPKLASSQRTVTTYSNPPNVSGKTRNGKTTKIASSQRTVTPNLENGTRRRQRQLTLFGDTASPSAATGPKLKRDPYEHCIYILGPTKPMKQTTLLRAYPILPKRNKQTSSRQCQ